jgi:hypothetical protein
MDLPLVLNFVVHCLPWRRAFFLSSSSRSANAASMSSSSPDEDDEELMSQVDVFIVLRERR